MNSMRNLLDCQVSSICRFSKLSSIYLLTLTFILPDWFGCLIFCDSNLHMQHLRSFSEKFWQTTNEVRKTKPQLTMFYTFQVLVFYFIQMGWHVLSWKLVVDMMVSLALELVVITTYATTSSMFLCCLRKLVSFLSFWEALISVMLWWWSIVLVNNAQYVSCSCLYWCTPSSP